MKKLAIAAALALAVGGGALAQNLRTPAGTTPEPSARAPEPAVPAGLDDLEKATFACPKAALNAAAREVPDVSVAGHLPVLLLQYREPLASRGVRGALQEQLRG